MTSFAHTDFPHEHRGVARAEAAFAAAGRLGQGFSGTRGISALLLAAVVSAVLVLAGRLVDTGSGLVAAWMVTWVVAFAALALFAAPARRIAGALVKALDDWSASLAEARADQRLWAVARADARVMGDLQAAMGRAEVAEATQAAAVRPASAKTVTAAPALAQTHVPAEAATDLRAAVPQVGAVRSYYYYL